VVKRMLVKRGLWDELNAWRLAELLGPSAVFPGCYLLGMLRDTCLVDGIAYKNFPRWCVVLLRGHEA
jgi:hypothetical protein